MKPILKSKQVIGILFTVAVVIYSGWYHSHPKIKNQLDDATLSSTVESTVTQLSVHQFNTEGELATVLTTPLMEHIPKGDMNVFQKPHIIIAQKDQPSWEIRSLKGQSFDQGQRIVFIKQVVVHQNPGKKTLESTLKTEEVTYYPKEKKAQTDLLVTFEQPGNFIQSTGMNAYLDEKRVELLHQARGSYVPAKG